MVAVATADAVPWSDVQTYTSRAPPCRSKVLTYIDLRADVQARAKENSMHQQQAQCSESQRHERHSSHMAC